MNRPTESCRLILDRGRNIARWVCCNLGFAPDAIPDGQAVGFAIGQKLIGGLIYHDIRYDRDLWWTIYTTDKRWCTRKILKMIFALAFDFYKVKRISILVSKDNFSCLKLVEKLGFKREGRLRQYRDNGADCYIYGMLKSENLWKGNTMSKAIGKALGAGVASTSTYGSENNILNYLQNYDTSNYDKTLNNLTSYAANASNNLANMGNYNFNVAASDDARLRAEQATYNSYNNLLQPTFANQTNDLQARLANQGLSVGSEAYQRAMNDLQQNQNNALNQAAYQSVLNGQNAYSQSLQDQINSASFSNAAQSNYINQLLSALQNSISGYTNAMNQFNIQSQADNRIAQNKYLNAQAQSRAGNDFLNSAVSAAASAFMASDARLKENLKPVGRLDNGLTVYCFNFKGSAVSQIGLIAQEVEKIIPEAVYEGEDGFLKVNYDLACKTEEK